MRLVGSFEGRERMHIVLLNQAFHPDVVATAQMAKDLADALTKRGHTVTAIASRSIYGKSGAVLPKREMVDGIDVHRVGFSLFGKAGIAARLADFLFFYILAVWKILTVRKPDVVVGFTTPPFISLLAILSSWVRGSKAVYWLMDLYPDVPVACGLMKASSPLTRMFEWFSRFILKRSHATVVLGRCMQEKVLSKGAPADRVKLIPVWSDLGEDDPVAPEVNPYRKTWGLEGKFCVMYSGNFGIGHEALTICKAMERLKDRVDIKFVFVGGGKRRKEVEAFIKERGLSNAAYYDYVPREKIGESLSAADVHLISLREGCEGIICPSKLFGVMAVAKPSVYVGNPRSEIARVLTESDSGFLVREGQDQEMAEAITRLADDRALAARMGHAARRELLGKYDKATLCQSWVRMLETLVGGPAPDQSARDARAA